METLPLKLEQKSPAKRSHYKMSMIHEEDYQTDGPTPQKKPSQNPKIQKTTNDHIQEYQNNQNKAKVKESSQFFRTMSGSLKSSNKNLSPPQINRAVAFQSLNDHHDVRSDQSDYDVSVSQRLGRFNVKNISEGANTKTEGGFTNKLENLTEVITPDYTSIPSIENRYSNNDFYGSNMMPIQARKSFTEYSLKDNLNGGVVRDGYNAWPAMGNNNMMFADANISYQNRNDIQRTPAFTGSNPQQFFSRPLPPMDFERINENMENEREDYDYGQSSIHYSNKEEKGSPRSDSYYATPQSRNPGYMNVFSEKRQPNQIYAETPQKYQSNGERPVANRDKNYSSQRKFCSATNSSVVTQNPGAAQQYQMNQNMMFLAKTMRTMQEYQTMQFECLLKSHTQLMEKLIDKTMGMTASTTTSVASTPRRTKRGNQPSRKK